MPKRLDLTDEERIKQRRATERKAKVYRGKDFQEDESDKSKDSRIGVRFVTGKYEVFNKKTNRILYKASSLKSARLQQAKFNAMSEETEKESVMDKLKKLVKGHR